MKKKRRHFAKPRLQHHQSINPLDTPERSGQANTRGKPLLLQASQSLPAVFLNSPVRQPLVYRKRIRQIDPQAKSGDLVAVYADFSRDDEPSRIDLLGYGFLNRKAEIALRMIRFGTELPDESFWDALLAQAVELRRDILKLDEFTNGYRLIHAESDGLPGLVVDRYGDVLCAEVFALAMSQRVLPLIEKLQQISGAKHYLIRGAPHTLAQESFQQPTFRSTDLPESTTIEEYGTRFLVSHSDDSHKTGFFCDQRENRKRLAAYCAGKSVLDLCCYTGGFAVQAKRLGKASEVIGVDLDEAPLKIAKQNANLNQAQVRFVATDIFPYMRDMIRQGRQFDVVVLDPPKLIRTRSEYEEGKRAHYDMNRLALRLVKPGGIFFTCTCAGLLETEEFQKLVLSAARGSTRSEAAEADPIQAALSSATPLRILERTGAGGDHPIAANALETEYLRGIWCQRVPFA